MSSHRMVGVVCLAALVSTVLLVCGANSAQPNDPRMQTGRVQLSKLHDAPENTWLRAFVVTESLDARVHVTLNEMGAHQSAADGTIDQYGLPFIVSGAARQFRGRRGILVTVWFNGEIPPDIEAGLTVSQPGAKRFSKPIPFRGM